MRAFFLRLSIAVYQTVPRFDFIVSWLTLTSGHGNHFGHPLV